MRIHLLGHPRVERDDGTGCDVRGHRAWAVLALAVLSKRPLYRHQIAGLLFAEAADPLGALRWCLAALRRAIGSDCLRGDPLQLDFPPDAWLDVWSLDGQDFDVAAAGELLEGIEISAGLEFSTWLLIERERIASLLFEHGHQLSLRALSAGDHERAIRLAASSIRRRPLDEAGHVVLVKGLVLAGRPDAAADHVLATEREFASQLGEKPSLALRSAARQTIAAPPAGISQSTVVASLIEAGTAALAAGAVEAGLDCLRRAAESAESKRDDHLHAKALLELGKALVHAVRGYDDEGAIVLRQSVDLSRRCGSDPMAASGLRELGYVEALAGRRPSAATLLDEALACAHRDQDSLSGIHGTIAFNLVDWGRSEEGLDHYERSLDLARRAGNRRREIWSLGLGGWGQLRAERSAVAVTWLERCLENCQDTRWISFRPWPVAVLAEARLKQGADPGSLSERLEEAFALSCQLGDPCWEGATARGLALAHEGDGDVEAARHWLVMARKHCTRVSDQYKGLLVCILADQVRLAERAEDPEGARTFARELLSLASRTHADAHLGGALRALGLDPGI